MHGRNILAVVLIFFIFVLSGCATSMSDIEGAEAFCENNGGIKHIKSKYNSTVRIECANGAMFTFKGDK